MSIVTQISNNPNLFLQDGQKVVKTGDDSIVPATEKAKAEELQQQFLKILVTQLQNQNPLDPVDTTEFTNQLVQYSSLEQQIDTNLKLNQILDSLQVSSSFSAFSYIGNDVELATNMTAMQNDTADWSYALKGGADAVEIKVRNKAGELVYQSEQGKQNSGSYNFTFNKEDALIDVADGEVLYLTVNADDAAGDPVSSQILTNVKVDSVETGGDGSIVLRAGSLYFSVDDISKISRSTANDSAGDVGDTDDVGDADA